MAANETRRLVKSKAVITMPVLDKVQADVLAVDPEDNPLLLVKVKTHGALSEATRREVAEELRRIPVPFVMLADKSVMQFFRWDGDALQGPLAELSTAEVLSAYDRNFAARLISNYHFAGIISSWLSDVISNWKLENPPGLQALAQADLLAPLRVRGVATMNDVSLVQGLMIRRNEDGRDFFAPRY